MGQLRSSNSLAYARFRKTNVIDVAETATNLTGVNHRPKRNPVTPTIAMIDMIRNATGSWGGIPRKMVRNAAAVTPKAIHPQITLIAKLNRLFREQRSARVAMILCQGHTG